MSAHPAPDEAAAFEEIFGRWTRCEGDMRNVARRVRADLAAISRLSPNAAEICERQAAEVAEAEHSILAVRRGLVLIDAARHALAYDPDGDVGVYWAWMGTEGHDHADEEVT
jgi:hypothetical protein